MANELSINNLFIKNKSNKIVAQPSNNLNIFDIASCYKKPELDDILINKIKQVHKESSKRLQEIYDQKYNDCIYTINSSIDVGLTKTMFFVPFMNYGLKKYNHKECIEYILMKLKSKGFQAFENTNTIYIEWSNIV